MKPKPEVRVLAKQLFGACERVNRKHGWPKANYAQISDGCIEVWDAVAREAIRRLKK